MADSQASRVPSEPPVTAAALYGTSGRPHGSDIVQGGLGDCYLVSTLGQYADRQPDVIRNAIRYDEKDRNFNVSLYDKAGHGTTVQVTQDDLRADRTYGDHQAGGVDGPAYWRGMHADGSAPPAWPAVMEAAYAKLNAASAASTTNADLSNIGHGGWPKDAIHALTGRSDTREVQASQLRDADKAYELLSGSINEGRPVLLATNPMKDMPTDGLVRGTYVGEGNRFNSGHAYTVEGISRAADGAVSLTLRNPWGNNTNPKQGVNSTDPIVRVGLKTILDNGHLENVTIGPAMVRRQTVSDRDRPEHAARQNGQPAPGASARDLWAAAATRGTDAAAPPDRADAARGHWATVAARGADATGTSAMAAQTGAVTPGQSRGRSL